MKLLKVKKSKIHGSGLFLAEPAKRGEIICFLQGKIYRMHNKNLKDSLAHACWIGVDEGEWINPVYPFRYLNHSCSPSAGIMGRKTLVALRNLKKGDEITIDYSITEEDSSWYIKCSCGAPNCRKTIRAVQFLSLKTFKSYLPFVPTYFKNVYIKSQQTSH